ncbi:unnamed protein product [Pleuronectes platessa]|uniref:Uncharacterized protein n=1 Tax=Pleuronectes platessa TaxID=8262 RepID=A0A9N7YGQ3_PLEPL|nr:unnamed protein product [Pleuronectes platessa]
MTWPILVSGHQLVREDNCILLWEQQSRGAPVSTSHVSRRQPMAMCGFGSYASLLVKVNGVSPELSAVANGVPIDPTHSHRCCSPYGTAEGVFEYVYRVVLTCGLYITQ